MKPFTTFTCLLLAGHALLNSAQAATLRQDPVTHQKYFIWDEDAAKPGVVLGWTFEDPTASQIDFEKIAADDEAYIESIVDQLDDTINVLVDNSAQHVIRELSTEKEAFRACYSAGEYGSNHCDLDLNYEASSRLAVVVLNAKWDTASVTAYRLQPGPDGLEVQASAYALLPILENDLTIQLDARYKHDAAYQKVRGELADTYTVAGFDLRSDDAAGYVIDVTFRADGEVPKEDSFSFENARMTYRVSGKSSYSSLTFRKL